MFNDDLIYTPDPIYRASLPESVQDAIKGNDFYDACFASDKKVSIPFTRFVGVKDVKGVEDQLYWNGFVSHMIGSGHKSVSSKSGSLIGGYWLTEKGTRSNQNVEQVFLFICDVDTKLNMPQPPTMDEIKAWFHPKASGIYGCKVLGYTTYNHSEQSHRYRLIFPLARTVMPCEYAALWKGFNQALGGILDPATKDISRMQYYPICPVANLNIAQSFSANDAGDLPMVNPEPLIVEGLLRVDGLKLVNLKSFPKQQLNPLTQLLAYPPTPENPAEIAKINNALSYINADCDYPTYRDVVWAILSTGWKVAVSIAEQWSLTAPHRFDEKTLQDLVNSYNCAKGIHYGTLIYHARRSGYPK